MQITLEHHDGFHFTATSEQGRSVAVDGDNVQGTSPMQLVLMALGGCSAIDVVDILRKGRQEVKGLRVAVEGERRQAVPRVFTRIHAHYAFEGELDPARVRRAVALSLETYCSVSKMLEASVAIEASFSINGTRYVLEPGA